MSARQKIQAARTALILDQPFFGVLALRLAIQEDPGCGTAWVDGATMGYDPEFIDALSSDQTIGLVIHEVMHCACGHPWRRDGRDHERFNIAADYAINQIVVDAGFQLPEGGLLDAQYKGKSAEWIYERLPKPPKGSGASQSGQPGGAGQEPTPGPGQRGGQPGTGAGDVRDAPAAKEAEATESDWQQAVQQAATAAKLRGKLPGSLERFTKEATKPRVDWKSVLRRFVQQAARADYSWTRPNPRYLARGLYLPALRSYAMGPIAVAIDTSGSIDTVLLAQFAAELRAVVDEAQPSRTYVIYCDARVQRIDTFERDDLIELKPKGGGGTAFEPALAAAEHLDEVPVCVVYLTDLMGSFPATAPSMPVLWAATGVRPVPFGEIVEIGG